MSPCNLDGKFGDVDGSCSLRILPTITPVAQVKGDSARLRTPLQPIISLAPQNNSKHPKTTYLRGPKGNAEAENEKRKPSPLKAGGEAVTPNVPKLKRVGTNDSAEDPPTTPTILTRQQQKEAGTPLMEGKQSIDWDFNK